MRARQGGHVQIAIGGRRLDEVSICQNRTDVADTLSYLSFPAHRHRASVEPDHLVVSTQAVMVVQLFAEGVLAPIGGPAVTVQIGSKEFGPCLLEAVETDYVNILHTTTILRFRRTGGP
ncbi:MAG: hypothetical protein ACYCV7_16630 [Acidimicrobiales bacterium]